MAQKMNDITPPALLPLDHLTILWSDVDKSRAFYEHLLPAIGFRRKTPEIWHNDLGHFFQFRPAAEGTGPYERHGAGVNHLGFRAPSREFVEQLHRHMTSAGYEARLQQLGGTLALFMPDPDGLRVEVSHYPAGTDPVD
jgi:lactoylglutathione lyase